MLSVVQLDFNKYPEDILCQIAEQIRNALHSEVLIIPTDVNFIRDLTTEQIKVIIKILTKELEEREEE